MRESDLSPKALRHSFAIAKEAQRKASLSLEGGGGYTTSWGPCGSAMDNGSSRKVLLNNLESKFKLERTAKVGGHNVFQKCYLSYFTRQWFSIAIHGLQVKPDLRRNIPSNRYI